MSKTIFQKIIDKEIPAEIHFENDEFIAINDINPMAPVHVLLIPKHPYPSLEHVNPTNTKFHCSLLTTARMVAEKLNISDNYKLFMNVGPQVQGVQHLHLHILGGWQKAATTEQLDENSKNLIQAGLDS